MVVSGLPCRSRWEAPETAHLVIQACGSANVWSPRCHSCVLRPSAVVSAGTPLTPPLLLLLLLPLPSPRKDRFIKETGTDRIFFFFFFLFFAVRFAGDFSRALCKVGEEGADKRKRWEDNICEWTGLGLSDTVRKAEEREKWWRLVVTSCGAPTVHEIMGQIDR